MSRFREKYAMQKVAYKGLMNELESYQESLSEMVQIGRQLAVKLNDELGSAGGRFESYVVERINSMAEDREMFSFSDTIDDLRDMSHSGEDW